MTRNHKSTGIKDERMEMRGVRGVGHLGGGKVGGMQPCRVSRKKQQPPDAFPYSLLFTRQDTRDS